MDRGKIIVRTSVIGILANALLAAFKAFVGIITGSIAVTLDAVNNLSDALSSVITIFGTKIAGKRPDKKHPLGHGRVEYLTAAIISVIVLYAGVTSLGESVKKIIHPETPEYTTASLIIIAAAVVVKILLGRYVKGVGERVQSDALIASGTDATMDSVISLSTLVAAAIFLIWGLSLEAWLGAIISLVIIKSGLEMLRGAISTILGERADSEVSRGVKEIINTFEPVSGAYDLLLHSYGPDKTLGSVHIEVPDTMTAGELDVLEREIVEKVMDETGVILTGISVYSVNTTNDAVAALHEGVRRIVMSQPYVLQMHGFFANEEARTMQFDVVIDFAAPDMSAAHAAAVKAVAEAYPDYQLNIALDQDLSD